jgi:hypothetical protein
MKNSTRCCRRSCPPRIAPFGGQIELFYGDRTGYWPWHISHFDALISSVEARRPDRPIRRRIQIVKERYQRHIDTIPPLQGTDRGAFRHAGIDPVAYRKDLKDRPSRLRS